jgi:RNA polymerase sigma-70 factor (ECF subfamily)
MVESPDGKGFTVMSSEAGNGDWKRYELPVGQTASPLAGADVLSFIIKGATIFEVAAFSATTDEWATQRLLRPINKQIAPVIGPGCALFQEGNNFYAFSAQKGRWDVLSLPDQEKLRAQLSTTDITVQHGDQIFVFPLKQARWSKGIHMKPIRSQQKPTTELLRSRLERRGWKTSEDLIGSVFPASHALRTPAQLIDHCVRAADGLASPGVAEGTVYVLMKGALRSMFWNRMKAGAAALVVIVSLAGTAGMLSRGSLASGPGGDSDGSGPLSANVPSHRAEPGTESLSVPTIELAALDPQAGTGKPPTAAPRKRAADASDDITVENAPPVVVKTVPRSGDTEVDPNLHEIQVTFSKEMLDKSWSWSTASKNTFPDTNGDIRYLDDRLTCVLPVKLKPGRSYATWINSGRFTNFKDRDYRPAVPYLLVFRTKQ